MERTVVGRGWNNAGVIGLINKSSRRRRRRQRRIGKH
jgi:hypothetical protein